MHKPFAHRCLKVARFFTRSEKRAGASIVWADRSGMVRATDGHVVEVGRCEAPSDWSQLAVDTAVTRYRPCGQQALSIRMLVERVAQSITDAGRKNGIFATARDATNYQAELAYACLARYGWFAESVWQDVGVSRRRGAHCRHLIDTAATRPGPKSEPLPYQSIHATDDLMRDRKQLRILSQKAHAHGAVTIHFDDTLAAWHTCPASGPAVGASPSNGCLFLKACACTPATINVNRFMDSEGLLDIDALRHVVFLFTVAADLLVESISYANRNAAQITRAHRALGVSYAGLAPLLMRNGLPYDSDSGRSYAAALTSFITATACATSQSLARATKPFSKYDTNRTSLLAVIRRHADAANSASQSAHERALRAAAQQTWGRVLATATTTGFRNAQFTMLAAAGIAGMILDCDASDLGPMVSLVTYDRTSEGRTARRVIHCVQQALAALRYPAAAQRAILAHILDKQTIEGAPGLKLAHEPVFACQSLRRRKRRNALSVEAQMRMIAAVQPSLSGCVQRSLILPSSVGANHIAKILNDAWKSGIRALNLYRIPGTQDGAQNTGKRGARD